MGDNVFIPNTVINEMSAAKNITYAEAMEQFLVPTDDSSKEANTLLDNYLWNHTLNGTLELKEYVENCDMAGIFTRFEEPWLTAMECQKACQENAFPYLREFRKKHAKSSCPQTQEVMSEVSRLMSTSFLSEKREYTIKDLDPFYDAVMKNPQSWRLMQRLCNRFEGAAAKAQKELTKAKKQKKTLEGPTLRLSLLRELKDGFCVAIRK